MDALDLVGMVASRICHDFAGPVGAISNGIELLADEQDPDVRAEFAAMLGSAASKLAARLRFYRLMAGSGGRDDVVQVANARSVLTDMLDSETSVVCDWRADGEMLTMAEVALMLALAMLGAEAMPRGGTLHVAREPHGWTVTAEGPRAMLTADVLAALADDRSINAGSRAALAYFARATAGRLGLAIRTMDGNGRITLTAVGDR